MLVVTSGSPALAGGAALDFDQEWYQPGDVAHASTSVSNLAREGTADDGPYYAYLEPNPALDGTDTDTARIAPDAIPLGPLTVEPQPAGALVSIEFTVPDVPAGGYSVTYCNDPCTAWLGDLVGGWTWIGMPPVTAPPDTAPPVTAAPATTSAPEPAVLTADRSAAAGRSDGHDWVPWVGATAVVLVLVVAAGGLHLAARRRA